MGARGWLVLLLAGVLSATPASAEPGTWEQWQHLVGVVEVAGPRSDGNLVVMANGQLWLVSSAGSMTPFARGADGYSGSVDGEPYMAVVPQQALSVPAANCAF